MDTHWHFMDPILPVFYCSLEGDNLSVRRIDILFLATHCLDFGGTQSNPGQVWSNAETPCSAENSNQELQPWTPTKDGMDLATMEDHFGGLRGSKQFIGNKSEEKLAKVHQCSMQSWSDFGSSLRLRPHQGQGQGQG